MDTRCNFNRHAGGENAAEVEDDLGTDFIADPIDGMLLCAPSREQRLTF